MLSWQSSQFETELRVPWLKGKSETTESWLTVMAYPSVCPPIFLQYPLGEQTSRLRLAGTTSGAGGPGQWNVTDTLSSVPSAMKSSCSPSKGAISVV